MEADNFFMITFKYGGHWVTVKKQDRKKYDGWKQKTVKISKEIVSISLLFEEIEKFCPWICGLEIELAYHVFGTSPKEYRVLAIEDDVREMVTASNGINQLEVVITSSNSNEDIMGSYDKDVRDNQQIVECANVCNESFEVDQNEIRETLQVGAHFIDSVTLRNALRSYAIVNNFGLKIKASDRKRVIATCSYRGCPWRVRASVCADGQSFEVRKIAGTHICPGVNRAGNRQATSCWIANQIQDLVKKQPDVPPKMIKNNLESTYGLSLPYMKLWRSRELARGIVFGSVDDNYSWVPTLRAELAKRNLGSHITYTYDSVDNSFQRFFVSFKVCIDGFLAGCRRLVGLDACHLKSKYLDVLLSANALDGNNGLFNLAFAVVETESKHTWGWFLENLHTSIGFDLHPLAFISDMEKGLAEALKTTFPDAEHRVCLRHLWKNLKKFFHCPEGQKIQNLIWSAANANIFNDYEKKMNEIHSRD